MKRSMTLAALTVALGLCAAPSALAKGSAGDPYPADLGPATLPDSVVKSYPEKIQAGYKLLLSRCSQCHTASRPLNSRFVEPPVGADEAKQKAALAELKKTDPEVFSNPAIWEPGVKIWMRYIKRMMNKPGCDIAHSEGAHIWEFLTYDSVHRKTGANAKAWQDARQKLLDQFKAQNPKRYETLKAAADL